MFGLLKALVKTTPDGHRPEHNPQLAEAARLIEERNFAEAERLLAAACQETERAQAPAATRLKLMLELAGVQRLAARGANGTMDTAKLEAALRTAGSAIELSTHASNTGPYVACLDTQAAILLDLEHWNALESVLQDALRLGAALPQPDPAAMAQRVCRLASALARMGKQKQAADAYERAMQLHEEAYGPEELETAGALLEAGKYHRSQRAHVKAQACLKRALQIHEALGGPESPQALQDLQQLAGSYEEAGNFTAAAAQYERALSVKLRKLGVGNLDDIADMQFALARLHIGWGNLTRARELLLECMGDFRRRRGPGLAVAHETLAQVEQASGRFHIAVQELEHATNAWERCGPAHTAELLRCLGERADLLERLKKARDAAWVRARIAELTPAAKPAPPPVVRKLVRPAAE